MCSTKFSFMKTYFLVKLEQNLVKLEQINNLLVGQSYTVLNLVQFLLQVNTQYRGAKDSLLTQPL